MNAPVTDAKSSGALLELDGLTRRFGAFTALSAVDLTIRAGEVHCLLGENGAGKSTLCNLVFGMHPPSEGEMRVEGKPYRPVGPRDALAAGIAMVHQHFSLVDEMSVVDNLMLGRVRGILDRRGWARRLDGLAERYGLALAPFARVGDLSIGERQRVEIVKCLMLEPRLLILDEPTAVLLPDEIRSLLGVCRRVAEEGAAVLLVTHKLAEIREAADRATVLRQGQVAATSEAPAREIERLVRAMIRRDLDTLDSAMAATLGVAEAGPAEKPDKPKPAEIPAGPDVLQIDNISQRDADGATRLNGVTLTLRAGEIVGLAGVEGNGQSELGLILAGLRAPDSGRLFLGEQDLTGRKPTAFTQAGIGIVPEDRHRVGAIVDMSVAENIFLNRTGDFTRFGLLRRQAMYDAAAEMMQRFDVRATGPDARFGRLSGGNQQKAVLARELTAPGLRFLLAAQPTRGLDVGAVEAVYALIREAASRGVAVLLISSELDEVLTVAHRIAVIYRGRIVGERPSDPRHRNAIGAMMAGQAAPEEPAISEKAA
ncbi:ABC transporter ATP-binding protein [Methylobacterium gnaphalii]|uniref:Sugar ABC transporter ATP-binding protein n=1 Tax=Methylobacterium gnaphalii TaxID=1010610 RepID=A0A512JMI2_9HYPH|nr:ABC transporter ATP-binding protein [Methylobacterium gnaphalii]GEP11179.1 sugar ABC transporter ATP-binding protein [Methylobacterium gnaphalii]GJD70049.1 Xylose import ATP-binding protein XylG [Methylobacterium gnaphalii]GLS49684.1 sugar ABC transporter ATP-binding protein [Methylobacterium gnaphalii]